MFWQQPNANYEIRFPSTVFSRALDWATFRPFPFRFDIITQSHFIIIDPRISYTVSFNIQQTGWWEVEWKREFKTKCDRIDTKMRNNNTIQTVFKNTFRTVYIHTSCVRVVGAAVGTLQNYTAHQRRAQRARVAKNVKLITFQSLLLHFRTHTEQQPRVI